MILLLLATRDIWHTTALASHLSSSTGKSRIYISILKNGWGFFPITMGSRNLTDSFAVLCLPTRLPKLSPQHQSH